MTDKAHLIKESQRYERAAHRVQTAIAAQPKAAIMQPKHMRVGIDMSKSDMAGLANLLISKGVITSEEYYTAIADQAEIEADNYDDELSVRFGKNISTL
jgi:hypothetical protein